MKKIICVDFDGVIYPNIRYHGTADLRGPPVGGAARALALLSEDHLVVIHSARCSEAEGVAAIRGWLHKNGMPEYEVCAAKPIAHLYLDDRAVRFNGCGDAAVRDIGEFVHYQRDIKNKARIVRSRFRGSRRSG